jgi:hypothetical protein
MAPDASMLRDITSAAKTIRAVSGDVREAACQVAALLVSSVPESREAALTRLAEIFGCLEMIDRESGRVRAASRAVAALRKERRRRRRAH